MTKLGNVLLASLVGAFVSRRFDVASQLFGGDGTTDPPSFAFTFGVLFWGIGLITFVYLDIIYPKLLSPLRGVPGPKGGSFFMGQFFNILKEPTGWPQRRWIDEIPNDGLLRYCGAFNEERLLPTSPEALRELLVTQSYEFAKPKEARFGLGRVLGDGVLIVEGDEHRRQRRLLNPAFAFRHVKDLYPLFWTKAQEAAERIRNITSRHTEIHEWSSRTTLDIIGEAGMGQDFGAVADPNNELSNCYKKIINPGRIPRFIILCALFLPIQIVARIPMKRNRDINAGAQYVRNVARKLVREKKARLEKSADRDDRDILAIAVESGGFVDEDLVSNCMTFLAAGHETTATAMTWAMWLLCKHPEVQERLRKEVREHLPLTPGADRDNITATDIDRLPYLNAVCNEVLRIYPPVPITTRRALHDTTLLGLPVPKNSLIIVSPWAVNTSKKLWGPTAQEFIPDRWIDSKTGTVNQSGGADSNFAFLTFLHGPRSCIGSAFARAEFAVLLAVWVGRFSFELEDPNVKLDLKEGATVRPKDGVKVKFSVVDA